ETYYYTSYLLGPTVIVLAMFASAVAEHLPSGSAALAVTAALVAVYPFVWSWLLDDVSVWTVPGIVAVAVLVAATYALGRRRRWFLAGALLTMALVPLVFTYSSPRDVPLE